MPAQSFLLATALVASLSASSLALAVPGDCDYLVITDSLLLPEAKRLADFRAAHAADHIRKPHVATMADVYQDYPTHGPKFRGLLAFLKDVEQKNGRLPDHLLLFGDASWDETSPDNRVPTYKHVYRSFSRWSPDTIHYDSAGVDEVYPHLLDSVPRDSLRPRTALGRVPAGSLEQARRYVDKVIAYEEKFPYGPMAFTFGYANDDDRQLSSWEPITMLPGSHEDLWHALAVKPFARRVLSIEFPRESDTSKTAARDSLLALFNAGPSRLYLFGHSSYWQFTDERMFAVPDHLPRLAPKPLAPIVAYVSSLAGSFAHPRAPSLGEELIFHPHGAVAFLGATRENFPVPNQQLFKHWDDTASRGGTLGRSFAHAKAKAQDADNSLSFSVMGDPGLTLRVPALNLVPAAGSGTSRLVLSEAGAAGDSVFYQVVQIDTARYADISAHPMLEYDTYVRERVVGAGVGVLGAKGAATLELPWAPNPRTAFVKVMTWNRQGMRYGHFPIADLGPISVRRSAARGAAGKPYRVELRGTQLRFLRGDRAFDLKGAAR